MRILTLFVCLVLSACTPNKCWIFREIIADCPEYSSTLLTSIPQNSFCGIEVQFLKGCFGTLGYLNVYSKKIPQTEIKIVIDQTQYLFHGVVMEGGQRLLLPDEATELLITALLGNQKIFILLEGFITELSPVNFRKFYVKFDK